MKILGIFLSMIILFTMTAAAETRWLNDITVNEYNITWGYTETFIGMDSMAYKIAIDSDIGNNDSFVNAWELLKADKEARKRFKSAIENELDIRINNGTSGIELIEVDSSLSQAVIGKIHTTDTIENRYNISYRLKESIYNASSIWFLGEPQSPLTILLPPGIDVVGVSGMDNVTTNPQVTGYFSDKNGATNNITKNASNAVNSPESPESNMTANESNENITEPASGISKKIREWGIIGTGIVFIVLIYIFKVRKN